MRSPQFLCPAKRWATGQPGRYNSVFVEFNKELQMHVHGEPKSFKLLVLEALNDLVK